MQTTKLSTRLSTKGQIILPKSVRDARQWKPGTEFSIETTKEGVLLRPIRRSAGTKLADLYGFLKYSGPPKSIKEMDRGILLEARRRSGRG
jgi:AbrB family looped-hinge helix DNA binding protein